MTLDRVNQFVHAYYSSHHLANYVCVFVIVYYTQHFKDKNNIREILNKKKQREEFLMYKLKQQKKKS